ncbi:MAG TPA: GGDEF domain-containing protein [Burkholderiales bacterium]|nr:GGDEF domain-containing protein [Burkholderiales bacterium]
MRAPDDQPQGNIAVEGGDTSERMRAQQLSLVFDQALTNHIMSPLVAALISVVLWPAAHPRLLTGWVAVLAVISLWRHLLATGFRRASHDPASMRLWERRFVVSLAAASAAWGVGAWLALPAGAPALHAFVYCFVFGMAAGASAIYAAHGASVAVSTALIMGPSTLYMLTYGDPLHLAMGVGGVAFVVASSRSVRSVNTALRRNIQLTGELERLAGTDALSGLSNRRAFTEFGETALANASRSQRPCSIVMIDIDRFKSINDRLGHAAGDTVIRALGAALAGEVRVGERAGRIGGEEFAVILPDGGSEQAMALAQRVQAVVRSMRPRAGNVPIEVTVSIGVASTRGEPCTLDELLARADKALYAAKHAGRNRTMREGDSRAAPESGDTASVHPLRRRDAGPTPS